MSKDDSAPTPRPSSPVQIAQPNEKIDGIADENSKKEGADQRGIFRAKGTAFDLLASPTALMGRTYSVSAVECDWRSRKHTKDTPSSSNSSELSSQSLIGIKRKFSSHEYANNIRLPNFVNCFSPELSNSPHMLKPLATGVSSPSAASEFIPPANQLKKQQSRPNSPTNAGSRLILPRSRVASIRRESDCSTEKKFGENEAAHEKLVKSAQQVSTGFESFCLDEKLFEERKRAKSLTEPISIFTSAFLPQSSSPSPTRSGIETQKQCYSPSTQQVVRSNLAYSPSPSPTPGSPLHRMRSMSPITVLQVSKRRYTGSSAGNGTFGGNASGLESDGESSANSFSISAPASKRRCLTPRSHSNASPLIREVTSTLHPSSLSSSSSTSMSESFATSSPVCTAATTSTAFNSSIVAGFLPMRNSRLLVDPGIAAQCFASTPSLDGTEEEGTAMDDDEQRDGPLLLSSFCSSFNDANSSTTFSSRANTPEGYGPENEMASLLPPPRSACSSSEGSSSRCSSHLPSQSSEAIVPQFACAPPACTASSLSTGENKCNEEAGGSEEMRGN